MTVLLTSARCFVPFGWLVVALSWIRRVVWCLEALPPIASHPFNSLVVSYPLVSGPPLPLLFLQSPLSFSCSFYSLHDSSRICLSNSCFLFFCALQCGFQIVLLLNELSGVFSLHWSLHFGFPFLRTSLIKGRWQHVLEFAPLLLHSRHSLPHGQPIIQSTKLLRTPPSLFGS